MESQKYDRFKDAPWFSTEKAPILIGGAGGIGSWLTMLATRAGFECHVYDDDTLETVNMAGQLFCHSDIGKPKVEALANIVRLTCDEEIYPYNERVDENTMTNNIVYTAFDNITARRHMFESWLKEYRNDETAIFIDGRLMAEQLTLFIVRGGDAEAIHDYHTKHLPSDDTIADAPCTFKQVSHNAAMIAAKMVAFLTNFMTGVRSDDKSRATPYFTEYMTALDWQRQSYRPVTDPSPAPDSTFEGQATTSPSNEIDEDEYPEENEADIEYMEEVPEAPRSIPMIFGTGGDIEGNAEMAQAFFTPPAGQEFATIPADALTSIPRPSRFINPNGVSVRDLIRAKNLIHFPKWIQVSNHLTSAQMLEHFSDILLFSEREWLRANSEEVFITGVAEPYHGIPELMRFLPMMENLADNTIQMTHQAFDEMMYVLENRIPENFDEARRIALTRNIVLTDELPF